MQIYLASSPQLSVAYYTVCDKSWGGAWERGTRLLVVSLLELLYPSSDHMGRSLHNINFGCNSNSKHSHSSIMGTSM